MMMTIVPKRVARTRKDGHVHARDDDDEALLLDGVPPRKKTKASQQASQSVPMDVDDSEAVKSPAKSKPKTQKPVESDSETEPESDAEELLLDSKPSSAKQSQQNGGPAGRGEGALPTPALSQTQDEDEDGDVGIDDDGRAPGRIIGETHPLEDVEANLASGDLVSKIVEDLAYVVKRVVIQPFASKRTDELVACLRKFRELALDVSHLSVCDCTRLTCPCLMQEDEIDAWNRCVILRSLLE